MNVAYEYNLRIDIDINQQKQINVLRMLELLFEYMAYRDYFRYLEDFFEPYMQIYYNCYIFVSTFGRPFHFDCRLPSMPVVKEAQPALLLLATQHQSSCPLTSQQEGRRESTISMILGCSKSLGWPCTH